MILEKRLQSIALALSLGVQTILPSYTEAQETKLNPLLDLDVEVYFLPKQALPEGLMRYIADQGIRFRVSKERRIIEQYGDHKEAFLGFYFSSKKEILLAQGVSPSIIVHEGGHAIFEENGIFVSVDYHGPTKEEVVNALQSHPEFPTVQKMMYYQASLELYSNLFRESMAPYQMAEIRNEFSKVSEQDLGSMMRFFALGEKYGKPCHLRSLTKSTLSELWAQSLERYFGGEHDVIAPFIDKMSYRGAPLFSPRFPDRFSQR